MDVFGFEMRSKKVLGVVSHNMPIIAVEPGAADELRAAIEKGVLAAEIVADMLWKLTYAALVGAETKDAGKRATPAAMRRTDDSGDRIMEQDRGTIGRQDAERYIGHAGDHTVGARCGPTWRWRTVTSGSRS